MALLYKQFFLKFFLPNPLENLTSNNKSQDGFALMIQVGRVLGGGVGRVGR